MFFERDETAIRFKYQCENVVHQTKIYFVQNQLEFSNILNLAVEIIFCWFVCSIFYIMHFLRTIIVANQLDV